VRFFVLLRSDSPEANASAKSIFHYLENLDHQVEICEHSGEPLTQASCLEISKSDLLISLGGDGTMLRAVETAVLSDTLVMGVNLGHLGYLTHVEPETVESSLERFIRGDFQIETRTMLSVDLTSADGQPVNCFPAALNEAVLERSLAGHTIRFEVTIAGTAFASFAADGIIISTATGSTGYNMSARGPILSPHLNALVVTPISPHMLFDRPLVLSEQEEIEISLIGTRSAELVVDGIRIGTFEPGTTVTCSTAKTPARLVVFEKPSFHAILKDKFQLKDR
jgi:NAD+ kinase